MRDVERESSDITRESKRESKRERLGKREREREGGGGREVAEREESKSRSLVLAALFERMDPGSPKKAGHNARLPLEGLGGRLQIDLFNENFDEGKTHNGENGTWSSPRSPGSPILPKPDALARGTARAFNVVVERQPSRRKEAALNRAEAVRRNKAQLKACKLDLPLEDLLETPASLSPRAPRSGRIGYGKGPGGRGLTSRGVASARGRLTSDPSEEDEAAKSGRRANESSAAMAITTEGGRDYEYARAALAKIKTGEEAVSFFALHGPNTPLKFVFLNRAPAGRRFRPYDLVAIDQADVDAEYFTMSAAGVVRIAPGEPSDFEPLSEWMRLSTIFNVISSIRFFQTLFGIQNLQVVA